MKISVVLTRMQNDDCATRSVQQNVRERAQLIAQSQYPVDVHNGLRSTTNLCDNAHHTRIAITANGCRAMHPRGWIKIIGAGQPSGRHRSSRTENLKIDPDGA